MDRRRFLLTSPAGALTAPLVAEAQAGKGARIGDKREGAMTYGFCPEDWPLFPSQIEKRGIELGDIERVEIRPDSIHSSVAIM